MTIADNYTPIRQIGDGVTTQFSASWSMIADAYATVFLEDAITGVQTTLTQGAGANQYQIAITASGFTVTFGTAPTASQYAVIGRTVTKDQSTPYKTSRGFQGTVEEASFDKLTALVQQLSNQAGRNISAPLGDTSNLQLPKAALRANSYLTFDASGNVMVASGITGTTVSTAMTPVVGASTLSAARVAMSVAGLSDSNSFTGLSNNFTQSLKLNGSPVINKIVVQKFTSSGTYTPTTGMVYVIVEVQAGGGGGGGAPGTGSSSCGTAGGSSGGYSKSLLSSATIGSSQTVTVGAYGSGGAAGSNNGSSGGNSAFGSLVTANGGIGGLTSAAVAYAGGVSGPSIPAAGTGNIVALQGCYGGGGFTSVSGGGYVGVGGAGGQSPLGVSCNQVVFTSSGTNGPDAYGYGSGGGGVGLGGSSAQTRGGNGSQGIVIVTEFVSA